MTAQPKSVMFHVSQSIVGPLRNWGDAEWKDALSWMTNGGKPFESVYALRQAFIDELLKGNKAIPIGKCDRFDPERGCLGHEIEQEESSMTSGNADLIAKDWVTRMDDPAISADGYVIDGVEYIVTSGTGETPSARFAYKANEVREWLGMRSGYRRMVYERDAISEYGFFTDGVEVVEDKAVAKRMLDLLGLRICSAGLCTPIPLDGETDMVEGGKP